MFILTSPVDEVLESAGITKRDSDFTYTNDAELLVLNNNICDKWRVSGSCGCERAFVGLDSLKATTLAIVGEAGGAGMWNKVQNSELAAEWKEYIHPANFFQLVVDAHRQISALGLKAGDFVRIIFDPTTISQVLVKA